MILAMKGIIPEDRYKHKSEIYDNEGNTVAIYLIKNHRSVPEMWKYNKE